MNHCIDKCPDELKNNSEKIFRHDFDTKYHIRHKKNDSGSQELFSDDDQNKKSVIYTPKITTKNETVNSSIISLNTPILLSKLCKETPGKAFVPKTPCDLLPFITKTNLLWTSDMETPERQVNEKSRNNETETSINTNNTISHCRESSPNCDSMKINNVDITSPILSSKIRSKRRAKRRILNNIILDVESISDQYSNINCSSDKLHSETTSSTSNEFASEIQIEIKNSIMKESNNLTSKENKNVEELNNYDKINNMSTQDFFSNASFSSIDQLCSNIIQEQKPYLIHKENKMKTNENKELIKEEVSEEKESNSIHVSNNILERVAAIRRNQKPFRRSFNSYTVLPKHLFTKSVRELELADLQFSQETNKALDQTSFKKIIENQSSFKNNKSFIEKNEIESFSQFVPLEIMDDWNIDNASHNQNENLHLRNSPDSSNSSTLINSDANFCTANGKGITISDENLQKSMKIYKEIENEMKSSNDIFNLKKSNAKSTLSKQLGNQVKDNKIFFNSTHNLISNNNSCINKLPNIDNNFNNVTDTLSVHYRNKMYENKILDNTAENKNLTKNAFYELKQNKNISNNSEFNSLKSCAPDLKTIKIEKKENELSFNENMDNCMEKIETFKIKQELTLDEFLEGKFTFDSTESSEQDDGFTTAGGKGIKINEEKESYYLEVFNKLSEDIQDKKNQIKYDRSNISHINKPLDKAPIVFNKKPENMIVRSKLNSNNIYGTSFHNHNKFSNLPCNNNVLKNKVIDDKNCFNTVNANGNFKSSTIIQNKQKMSLTTIQNRTCVNKENLYKNEEIHVLIKNDASSKKNLEKEKTLQDLNTNKNEENLDHMEKLKQRLNGSEIRRSERCRSFSGFPVSDKGIAIKKLNKSDPVNESFSNQPLKNGLSISQFFDSHSDSWLSKVEISHLNNSKVKTPDLKRIKIEKNEIIETSGFLGFSYKECTENFRQYATFKKFLKKLDVKSINNVELNIDSGHSISLYNQTLTKQRLLIQCEQNVNIKKHTNESSYKLIESKCDMYINNINNDHESKNKTRNSKKQEIEKVSEKRKHIDIDNDTPLSTLKKPRIGNELQARKLFCDELNDEDNDFNILKQMKNEDTLTLSTVPAPTDQERNDFLKKRVEAILDQDKIIRHKKQMKINIKMGSLLQQRITNNIRIPWAKFVGNSAPIAGNIKEIMLKHPDAKILGVTASNATCYKFSSCNSWNVSLNTTDGGIIIFDETGHAGVSEFIKAFLAMPGVDPKLLPTDWIENHYRWIVWKLASIDRISFNTVKILKMLTPERVIKELKYRYDREIDRAERPALRKILEKDDVSTRRMVLCISSIKKANDQETEKGIKTIVGLSHFEIEATDGWYSVPLTIDNAMANYVSIGKIKEGTKIITYGAELLKCQRGYFPLEKPASVSLKIHTNCTRRARWDAKLGYQRNSRPIPVKLRDIVAGGGMVGQTTVVAARTYPLLFREKTPSGQSIYRNARAEEKAASSYERSIELKVDAMYAEAEKNFESKTTSESDEEFEIAQVQKKSMKIDKNHWDRKQRILKQKLESQMRQDLPVPRQVTVVLKVRLVHDKTSAILSVWGAKEESGCDIKEGDTITIYNSLATGTRGGELNLTANRITHIKKEPLLKLPYPKRTCTPICDIGNASFEPMFNEFDTVGVIVSSGVAPYGMKNFEMINLAHPKPNNDGSSFLSILFWNGMSAFGYQGMLAVGSLVSCSNLEWRRNSSCISIPMAYCSEKTVFTCHPRQSHLMKELRLLKALVQNPSTYAEACAEEVTNELSKRSRESRTHQVTTPGGWPSPLELRSPGGPSVQRRLEKLSRYGNPTDASPAVVLNDSSDRVRRDFTPVTRKRT